MTESTPARSGLSTLADELPGAEGVARAGRTSTRAVRRRTEILRAALAIFAARGYRNGSLAEIAEQVGITHQGVLHHFGSKEQLFVEVLKYRDLADVENFENHQAPEGPAFLQHLVRTVEQNTARAGIVQAYAVLSAESVTEGHPAQDWFRDRFTGLRAQIADALRASCPPAALPSEEELDAAASAIIALMDGLQVQWLLDADSVDMPRTVEMVIDMFLARWGSTVRSGEAT